MQIVTIHDVINSHCAPRKKKKNFFWSFAAKNKPRPLVIVVVLVPTSLGFSEPFNPRQHVVEI